MPTEKVYIELAVTDKGSVVVKQFTDSTVDKVKRMSDRSIGHVAKLQDRMQKGLAGAIGFVGRQLTSLKALALGALAGWGLKRLAEGFIDTGSKMDQLKLSLDTITKGKGDEWFGKLNEWALKMPINTEKAITAFKNMRAMGLEPTIKDMTTLVDTASAIGGGEETLLGVARALGQIQTKGRVSTEELLQLAERGIPVFDILREKMGLTSEQLGNIGNAGLDAGQTIDAIFAGMAERFGGQSDKMQGKWAGLTESLKSYWAEFQRLVMDSGVMQFLEAQFGALVGKIDKLYQDGTLQLWAQEVSDYFVDLGGTAARVITGIVNDFADWREKVYWLQEDLGGLFEFLNRWWGILWELFKKIASFMSWWLDTVINPLLRALGRVFDLGQGLIGSSPSSGSSESMLSSESFAPSYAVGTGPAGLPATGLYYGHKGEIVLNSAQSQAARRDTGRAGGVQTGDIHIHIPAGAAPQTPNDWRLIVRRYIKPELEAIGRA